MLNRSERIREQQAMRRRIRVAVALRRLVARDEQPEVKTDAKAA